MNALGRLYEMNIDLIYKIEISFSEIRCKHNRTSECKPVCSGGGFQFSLSK